MSDRQHIQPIYKYVDKFGHRHIRTIEWAWSAAVLKAMGVKPIEEMKEPERATLQEKPPPACYDIASP